MIRGLVEIVDLGNEHAKLVVLNQRPDQNLREPRKACIFWESFPGDFDVVFFLPQSP